MKYIDTSAFVKYYGEEEFEKGANKINGLIEKAKTGEVILVSSIFMLGEAISVFDKWTRLKIITEEESQKIISRFLSDVKELSGAGGLILEPIDSILIMFSIEFVMKHHVPVNDAIHLYTALTLTPEIEEFICSDEMLNKAAKEEGLNVYDPEG